MFRLRNSSIDIAFERMCFSAVFLLATVVLFQIQARYRNMGFQEINFSDVSLTKLEGNAMFSTSLVGFQYIPSRHDYFYDNFPGETVAFPDSALPFMGGHRSNAPSDLDHQVGRPRMGLVQLAGLRQKHLWAAGRRKEQPYLRGSSDTGFSVSGLPV